MKIIFLLVCLCSLIRLGAAEPYADRFVWVFGWNLGKDSDVTEISRLLQTAGQHGCNGAVVSFGLDTLCQQSPDYFRRLEAIKLACEQNHLELIPSVFSVGYGGGALAHDRNLAEGLPVENEPFLVTGGEARLVTSTSNSIVNGSFEDFNGNKIKDFDFYDQPGEISFVDSQVKHTGNASLRLENFTANPHGHGRVMETIKVVPHRSYRLSLWVKTENLQPASAFRVLVLSTNDHELAPREFHQPPTSDWRKVTMIFNSLNNDRLRLYAGLWGGKAGKLWLDDWCVEEIGPVNVLRRPGTPVTVRNEAGTITYVEGKDYAPFDPKRLNLWHEDGEPMPLKTLPGSTIREGDHLRVSWYHPMIIHDSQITVCMAEPALYEIFNHEAALLEEKLHPRRVLLNMDEIRMGGTCRACQGHNMGELLGQCVTSQVQTIHRHSPEARIYIWSDMFDPTHNAHGDYYLVKGDFTGSWRHVPKDTVMAVWSGEPREKSLRFFADQGFSTLVACYYDADDLNDVKNWLQTARPFPNVRGFMYTPWQKKYTLLPAFGDLLQAPR